MTIRDVAPDYVDLYADDAAWLDAIRRRFERIEGGQLEPKIRELVFVAGYLVNRHGEAARIHQARARAAGATDDDIRLLLKILDFYRGLCGFQDAQSLVSFWRSGVFPEIKPAETGSVADTFAEVVRSRGYVANGFRVYAADGEWLRIYLARSDAIRAARHTLDERGVQLLSFALTLKNHRYSGNFNDGCIHVHEDRARAKGAGAEEILEIVQILELCESVTTAWEGRTLLDFSQ